MIQEFDQLTMNPGIGLIEEHKKMVKCLMKNGIKLREHKWTELGAS